MAARAGAAGRRRRDARLGGDPPLPGGELSGRAVPDARVAGRHPGRRGAPGQPAPADPARAVERAGGDPQGARGTGRRQDRRGAGGAGRGARAPGAPARPS